MTKRFFATATLAAGLLAWPILSAAADEPAKIALEGPHLFEAHRRSSNLTIADLNGDGVLDFAAVSNNDSLLRIWYAKEDTTDGEPFEKEDQTLNYIIRDMVATDVNGDGRIDLVMAASPSQLVLMVQNENGRLQKGQETDLEADMLNLGDLTGDGRDDLLVVTGQTFHVLPSTTRAIDLEPAQTFYAVAPLGSIPMILDLNGDGKNDIVYQAADRRDEMMVRFQTAEGQFPDEVAFDSGLLRYATPVIQPKERGMLGAIHGKTRQLNLFRLEDPIDSDGDADDAVFSDPHIVGFDPATWDDKAFSAVADVDGDGRLDLLVAMPKSASIRLMRQTRTGSLYSDVLPCLKDLRQILPWSAKKGEPASLLFLSGEEKTVGVARVDDKDKDTLKFPKPLPLASRPLAMAIDEGDGSNSASLILAEETTDKRVVVNRYEKFDPAAGTLPQPKELLALGEKDEKPQGLAVFDLNQDGVRDYVIFFEYEMPAVYLQNKNGTLEKTEVTGILAGLLKGITAGRLSTGMLAGANSPDVMIVKDEYARAFHLGEDGQIMITEQFNSSTNRSRFRVARVAAPRGKQHRDVAILDGGSRSLHLFGTREGEGHYEELREIEFDGGDYQSFEVIDLDGDNRDDFVLIAPDRLAIVYARVLNGGLESIDSVETRIEEGGYGLVATVALDKESAPQLACVEMKEAMIEIFEMQREKKEKLTLDPFYHFKVYDSESSMAQRVNLDAPPEPREIKSADLNGDGKTDLVVLVHDYVIVYYQK